MLNHQDSLKFVRSLNHNNYQLLDKEMWYTCIYIDRYTYIHTHGILFSHKMEGNPAIYDNMDESAGYYANEIDHTEKDKYCMIKLTWGI